MAQPCWHPVLRWIKARLHNSCYDMHWSHSYRGPLVVYDPADPLKHLYDVDDGKWTLTRSLDSIITMISSASTVITLGDWYHQPAQVDSADLTVIAP